MDGKVKKLTQNCFLNGKKGIFHLGSVGAMEIQR